MVLENCSINAEALAYFLRGLNELNKVETLQLKRMQIELVAAQEISLLVKRNNPLACVDTLWLENCVIGNMELGAILDGLVSGSNLKELKISGASFTDHNILQLMEYIQSTKLQILDLNNTRLHAEKFYPILNVIARNKKLIQINLAWTKLTKGSPHADDLGLHENEHSSTHMPPQDLHPQKNPPAPKHKHTQKPKSNSEQLELAVTQALKKILKSDKLIHIDLSHTGLS